jgi:GNAT superfamily N-acetyltransferase
MQSITDKQIIFNYYQTFNNSGESREFLYVPTLSEVEYDLSKGMIYLGITALDSNRVVAMQEMFELNLPGHYDCNSGFPTFAFFPPKWDLDLSAKYFAVSGVYVDKQHRRQGLALLLLEASIKIAQADDAHGIYGDPNYLNYISQRVISKQFDIIGFTDGVTSGPRNEQSVYVTYYHSLQTKAPQTKKLYLNSNDLSAIEERDYMLQNFENIGNLTKHEFPWKDGKNIVYVLDDCVVKSCEIDN